MIAFAAALLCFGQAALPWGSLPEAEKRVSIKLPFATLGEALAEIRKQSGLTFRVANNSQVTVTVLVRDMKAKDLVEELADTLELHLDIVDKQVLVGRDLAIDQMKNAYLRSEEGYLVQQAQARANALLAALPTVSSPAPPEKENESLQDWAKRKIRTPAGYALALTWRGACNNVNFGFGMEYPLAGFVPSCKFVQGYAFKPAPTQRVLQKGHRSLDEFSARFEDTQVLVRYCPVAGAWRVARVAGEDPGQVDDDAPLVRFPQPTKPLAQTPFATKLAEWARNDPDSKVGEEEISAEGESEGQIFAGPKLSLADHLTWLYNHSKINIVANAFRVPSGLKQANLEGKTVLECAKALAQKAGCFASISKRTLRVRQGGYWRLPLCQPPEPLIRSLEATSRRHELTLDDYADFASELTHPMLESFDAPDRLLATCDLKPLVRGSHLIAYYGGLDTPTRRALWNGAVYDHIHSKGVDARRRANAPTSLADVAVLGPFGDVVIQGLFADILEQPWLPDDYTGLEEIRSPGWTPVSWAARYLKLIPGRDGNPGLFFGANERDGVLFWLRD